MCSLLLLKMAVLVVASVTTDTRAGNCTTMSDCSLNGDCLQGKCRCDPAWRGGPNCDVLDVLPVDETRAGGYHNHTEASWGGNVVFANGKYHLIVAQIVGHCGLESYGSNSAIVRVRTANFNKGATIKHQPPDGQSTVSMRLRCLLLSCGSNVNSCCAVLVSTVAMRF
jgi:hypothetical protein